MKKEEKKEALHVVAFLDLLGAGEIMKDSTESEIVFNKISELFDLAREKWIEQLVKQFTDVVTIKSAIFSDNIVFAIEWDETSENSKKSFLEFSQFVSYVGMFLAEAICKKLVFRGGITVGRLYIDNYQIWGEGLRKAHELEEKNAIFPRVIFDNDLREKYPQFDVFKIFEMKVKKDFDDFYYVDYLSGLSDEKDRKNISDNITQIVQEQKEKNKNKTKVLMKYEWLKQYSKCLINKCN